MIRLVNVSKYYQSENNVTLGLSKANIEFKLNEFVVITGESGSGKSTLLNVISGIDSYENGEMYFNNEETSYYDKTDWENYRKNNISFVFQNYGLIDSYTVYENVVCAMIINNQTNVEEKAIQIIKQVGLYSHIKHKATKLSGGQKQRLAIARAIAKDCNVLVADEPTGNLDSATGREIIALLQEISKTRLVIMVTHNYEEVKDVATRKIRVFEGQIAEDVILKNVESIDVVKKEENEKQFLKNSLFFSMLNVKSQPRRTLFTFLVTIFMSILVGVVLTTYVYYQNNDVYSDITNTYFNNLDEHRVVIKKEDSSDITADDYDILLNINNVESIFKYDYLLDLGCDVTMGSYSNYFYINSIDRLPTEILYGRMPTNNNDVVISLPDFMVDEDMVNQEIILEIVLDDITELNCNIVGIIASPNYERIIYANDDLFYGIDNYSDQYSLFIDDYDNLNKVTKELEKLGYMYISPYESSMFVNDAMAMMMNTAMMVLLIVFIIAIYFLGYVVLKLIFSGKRKDYGILKSIGMDKNTILIVNIFELLIYFTISFIFSVVVIEILTLFISFFSAFKWYHYSYLLIINILLAIFVAVMFNKSMNKKSVIQTIRG